MTGNNKERKKIKSKMAEALNDNIKGLSAEMQEILLDDMVTAFETRIHILHQAQNNIICIPDIGVEITQ